MWVSKRLPHLCLYISEMLGDNHVVLSDGINNIEGYFDAAVDKSLVKPGLALSLSNCILLFKSKENHGLIICPENIINFQMINV
ncbi:hypothetical protein HZS_2732 [Henneguya salminicola]|nr:hypothetical protein HZS_2732 [Henneguya salminicola]